MGNKLKSLLALSVIGIFSDSNLGMYRDEPRSRPVPKSTLSKPQKLKRKSKNTSAKKARKMNRK
jgi:hypothetical protein